MWQVLVHYGRSSNTVQHEYWIGLTNIDDSLLNAGCNCLAMRHSVEARHELDEIFELSSVVKLALSLLESRASYQ
jgi:hypothetical protein